jgi:hypothetical protein
MRACHPLMTLAGYPGHRTLCLLFLVLKSESSLLSISRAQLSPDIFASPAQQLGVPQRPRLGRAQTRKRVTRFSLAFWWGFCRAGPPKGECPSQSAPGGSGLQRRENQGILGLTFGRSTAVGFYYVRMDGWMDGLVDVPVPLTHGRCLAWG